MSLLYVFYYENNFKTVRYPYSYRSRNYFSKRAFIKKTNKFLRELNDLLVD